MKAKHINMHDKREHLRRKVAEALASESPEQSLRLLEEEILDDVLRQPSPKGDTLAKLGARCAKARYDLDFEIGFQRGHAWALIHLLKKRFGRLPPHVHKRISVASVMSIEVWLDRALDASDLDSVFGTETTGFSRPLEHETH